MNHKHLVWTWVAWATLCAASPLAQAQAARGEPPREAYGPGMMGGYGGYGRPGAGPYGPGMMHGPAYGRGQAYDSGHGPGFGGMVGLGPLQALDLNEQQQARIHQIRDDTRRKNWDTMGKLMDEQARLRDLLAAEKREPAAIGKQSMKIADLRRQLLESTIESHNRIEAVLSKEQKDQLRSYRRGWMMGDED